MSLNPLFIDGSMSNLTQQPCPLTQCPAPFEVPLFTHKIRAGFPSPATDYIEDGLDLNAYLVRHKAASFYFTVEGDSMKGVGILNGDKVLVDRGITPRHGHVVVAVINGEFTLKTLYALNAVAELRPENPAYRPLRINEGDDVTIWGVATGVIRKLRA